MSNRSKTRRTVYTVLLSVCLFLGVICACLLVALVLIGKHLALQQCNNKSVIKNASVTDETPEDVISVTIKVNDPTKENDIYQSWRLPREVLPLHYDLYMNPNLNSGEYFGSNNISFQLKENRDHLIVNCFKLNITKVKLYGSAGEEIKILEFHEDLVHQLQVVDLEESLVPGFYYLYFEYTGSLKNRIVGFYESSYKNDKGEKRYIATSKLEPTYARQAFPCFDEPNYKAKFTVHIAKPIGDEYIALSNMNQLDDPVNLDNKTSMVSFNTSVPMSTYLTCFIVCDFKFTEETVKASVGNDVKLRVYATKAQVGKTKFALDVAKKAIAYYITYFNIEYPLPKLDMIAIPDFVSGAMEHWGLVTYRETALLYDEETSSSANKQRVATVVAHELAHMWFGNLVTLDWWNDLWLNEGFATYMQYKATHDAFPDWGMMDQFIVDDVQVVMNFDATLSSHPIVQTVVTPDQITEIFDSISYKKGASILRMLENAVGEEVFRNAVTNYLNKYKYANAVTKNLLDEIQAIEKSFNYIDFMDTWTIQMGFPVVDVIKNGDDYTLTQSRFLANPDTANMSTPSKYDYKWTIPVTYTTDSNPKQTLKWFDKSEESITINVPKAKWVKFNSGQVGYYRVNYPLDMWKTLTENIQQMTVADKTHLLSDAFSLSLAGYLPYEIPLSMTRFLKDEDNYVVWDVASAKLKALKTLLLNSPATLSKLESYVQKLVEPITKTLTWDEQETDGHLRKLLRGTVMDLAGTMNHKETQDAARERFTEWLNSNSTILPQNTKATIYRYGMLNATEDEFNMMLDIYRNETDAQEKVKLWNGLAAVRNETILKSLNKLAEDEKLVRSQDYLTCLETISSNPFGTSLIWNYVRKNWFHIVGRFTLNDRNLGRLIPGITYTFSSQTRLQEMKDFFNEHKDAGAGATARKQALEKVQNNIKWLDKYMKQVDDWLSHNS